MIRRDTADMWLANGDNVLLDGEIGYELDSRKMKIGYQSKSYSELQYFAGGITTVGGGLTVSEEGVLSVNNDQVVGELPAGTSMKSYVDGLIQGEGATRAQEDQLLNNRVDAALVELAEEVSDRQIADSALQQQITVTTELVGTLSTDLQAEREARIDADLALQGLVTSAEGDIGTLQTDLQTERESRLAGDAALQTQITANEGSISDVDDKFGSLSISGPTGGEFAADNVTDFVSDLLFRNATGDMGGLSIKVYVDNATGEINNAIDVIYDADNGTGIVTDLGAQINALTTRVTDLEAAVGALENKFDQNGDFTGNITGDLTGNTFGNHTGDVLDADGNVIVDVANANFNGNVLGNLTGNSVGNHYGSVYASNTTDLLVNGETGGFTGTTASFSGVVTALAGDGTADSRVITLADMQAYAPLVDPNFTGDVTAGGTVHAAGFQANAVGGGLGGDVYNHAGDTKVVDSEAGRFFGSATSAFKLSISRHAISSIDSNGSDGDTWDAAAEGQIEDGTVIYDSSKGAIYVRLVDGAFDGYVQLSA